MSLLKKLSVLALFMATSGVAVNQQHEKKLYTSNKPLASYSTSALNLQFGEQASAADCRRVEIKQSKDSDGLVCYVCPETVWCYN